MRLREREKWKVAGITLAAVAHAVTGDRKAALAESRKLFEADRDSVGRIEEDSVFAEVRKDPEYLELVRRIRALSAE